MGDNMRFFLIQRGQFRFEKEESLAKGAVYYDYMGSAEFEFGALPRSYRKIMENYKDYVYVNTGIYTLDRDELILFVNKKISDDVLESIKSFIENPYRLKEFSELEKIPKSSKENEYMRTDMWWCIDNDNDWMAFLNSRRELFLKSIANDYERYLKTVPEKPSDFKEKIKKLLLKK